jgi:hypothetical protein
VTPSEDFGSQIVRKIRNALGIGLAVCLGSCLPNLSIDEVFGEYAGEVPSGRAVLTVFPDQRWQYKLTGNTEFSRSGIWMYEQELTTETQVVITLSPFELGFQLYEGIPGRMPQRPSIRFFYFERARLMSGLAIRTCFGEYMWCLTKVKK